MHLGLSGEEYQQLCDTVTDIFHLAAISYLGVPKDIAWRVNVDGTRNVLELARDCEKLRRLNHFSTCYVSGDRVGVIAEDELDAGQTLPQRLRGDEVPRPSGWCSGPRRPCRSPSTGPRRVVGDSRTGEIDRFEGPYYLGDPPRAPRRCSCRCRCPATASRR